MPGTVKLEKISTHSQSDLRQIEIQSNNQVADLSGVSLATAIDAVHVWSSVAANSLQTLGRGSVDTAIATGAFRFYITGQAATEAKAAVTTGTAIGAQTVPADTWALYRLDIATGGTITVTAAAANATTGYSTEALAIAALPVGVTAKAFMGYLTLKTASGLAWVAATDALAGGSSGNPASKTNYYPFDGLFAATGQAVGPNGVVTSGGQGVQGGAVSVGTGRAWTGGRNGMLIPTVLAIGSTDTRVSNSTASTFNCSGASNIAKAAVAAGTAIPSSAQGTIPANQWGIFVITITPAGTISYLAGPSNYTSGYPSEAQAKGDLYKIFPGTAAGSEVCQMGYVTLKTKAATAWIAATDAFASGATGNVASATNYYSTQGIWPVAAGISASQLANREGGILGAANY